MAMTRKHGRELAAGLAGLAAPLALTAILIPFRSGLPNTDAALALVLVVAAAGHGWPGCWPRCRRRCGSTSSSARRAGVRAADPAAGASACRFQDGAAGIGNPPRLLRDGRIVTAGQTWDVEVVGPPSSRDIELLAEAGGLLQGRFLLTLRPETRPGLEQRLVAIGLADQAGPALAGARLAGQR
jgi:hypothetical protein